MNCSGLTYDSRGLDDVAHDASLDLFLPIFLSFSHFALLCISRCCLRPYIYASTLDDAVACAIAVCVSYDSRCAKRHRRRHRCRFLKNEVIWWLSGRICRWYPRGWCIPSDDRLKIATVHSSYVHRIFVIDLTYLKFECGYWVENYLCLKRKVLFYQGFYW